MFALQVGVFSATLPPEALEITRKFMNKPVSSQRQTAHSVDAARHQCNGQEN
jgi:superfamily II DNA/RNA helicase